MATVTIPIDLTKRKSIVEYCNTHISPQRYYLHNGIGGVGWRISNSELSSGWSATVPSEHAIIIQLKYA